MRKNRLLFCFRQIGPCLNKPIFARTQLEGPKKVKPIPNALIALVLLGLAYATGCSDQPTINVTTQEWKTRTEIIGQLTFGYTELTLSGTTNADKLSVDTFGDGVKSEYAIASANGHFNDKVVIEFTHAADSTVFTASTALHAYKNNQVIDIPINSPNLKYQ